MNRPLFSVLHPTARPHKWREIYGAWIGAAVHPENVEYVLSVDNRWGFTQDVVRDVGAVFPAASKNSIKVVWNTGRRCYVDSVNTAAKASMGRILIVIADDQYPCEEWDERLKASLWATYWMYEDNDKEFVSEVSTGTPQEHERGMIVMPILSRARYERLGYVFYPEYESMYADNDLFQHAKQDGVIIDARHLMFEHRHPGAFEWSRREALWDEVYRTQNRNEAYMLGAEVLKRRRACGFGDATKTKPTVTRGGIALALPGEYFSNVWVAKLIDITTHLIREGHPFCTLLQYTSEPGITRATIVKSLNELSAAPGGFDPEFILWIDDDQVVEAGQVSQLLADLEALPDADMVAGWTFIAASGAYFNQPQVSCGRMNLDRGELSHAEYKSVQAATGVFEVGWTGFPVVLMRRSALAKIGKHPFSHFPCPESPWGECGEDISFCKRLTDAGGHIYVDSRVFVPHLKLKAIGPVPPSKEEIELALTGRTEPAMPKRPVPDIYAGIPLSEAIAGD